MLKGALASDSDTCMTAFIELDVRLPKLRIIDLSQRCIENTKGKGSVIDAYMHDRLACGYLPTRAPSVTIQL